MRIFGSSVALFLALVLWPGAGLLEERGGVRLVGHTGSQAGFRSFFWIAPERGLAIIANFNTSPAPDVTAKDARPNMARVFDGLMDRFAAEAKALPTARPEDR